MHEEDDECIDEDSSLEGHIAARKLFNLWAESSHGLVNFAGHVGVQSSISL